MADARSTVAALRNVPLFRSLNQRQLESLARLFVQREFEAGAAMVTQGLGGQGLFVITDGDAQATRERQDGTRVEVNRFGPGDFFGELALLDDGVRTATVTALEPTRCLVLSHWNFISTLKSDGEMAVQILQEVGRRFRAFLDAA